MILNFGKLCSKEIYERKKSKTAKKKKKDGWFQPSSLAALKWLDKGDTKC